MIDRNTLFSFISCMDSIRKQEKNNRDFIARKFPEATGLRSSMGPMSDQVDIYVDFTLNGKFLCAMWHYRFDSNGAMEVAKGVSVCEDKEREEWVPEYTLHDTDEELVALVRLMSL